MVCGQASGRQWKEAGTRAGSLKSQNISSSWEEKMRLKAETKIFRENRAAAIATRKAKLQVRLLIWLVHACMHSQQYSLLASA